MSKPMNNYVTRDVGPDDKPEPQNRPTCKWCRRRYGKGHKQLCSSCYVPELTR